MLNGRTIIELTDVKTGVTEKIEKTNMVTNAINSYYKDNLLGLNDYNPNRVSVYFEKYGKFNSSSSNSNGTYSLLGTLIGGVLCYSSPLEENVDNFYAPLTNELIACANIEQNTYNELTRRGSFNAIESGETEKGYKFVWDFATHQGNGTISSLGLTSYWGGINGFDGVPFVMSNSNSKYYFQTVSENYHDVFSNEIYKKMNIIEFDAEKNIGISIGVVKKGDRNVITIWKVKLSITKRRLKFGYLSDKEVVETYEIPTTDTGVENFCTLLKDGNFMFADGKDGYWYGLLSGGSYTRWIKIKKDNYSVTTGEWDSFGFNYTFNKILNNNKIQYYSGSSSMIIKGDYIYVKTGNKIFIVNKNTGVVESTENSGVRIYWIDMLDAVWNYGPQSINFNFNFNNSNYGQTHKESPTFYMGTDRYDKIHYNFLENFKTISNTFLFKITNSVFITGFNGYAPEAALVTPYLATINNLQEPVTKTADKTMKITYILEEEDE